MKNEPGATSPLRKAWRIVVAVVGVTLTLVGIALLVLPGPGILVLLAGVSVLATEFVWARRILRRARETVSQMRGAPARSS